MVDSIILLTQTALVTFQALWLGSGVRDNILYPSINETFTAQVMDMAYLREDDPSAYALVAHRRVTSRAWQKAAFRLVVAWELLSTVTLVAAVVTLILALFGGVAAEFARGLALFAVLMFTTTWAMFLVVGNHFCYWFGHEGAQNTHFQMTLWGIATLIFLAVT